MPPKHKTVLKKFFTDRDITQDIQQRLQEFSNSSKYYMYSRAEFEKFPIDTSNFADSWILLNSGHIIKSILLVSMPNEEIFIYGKYLKSKSDLFSRPFPSSYLGIFVTDNNENFETTHVIVSANEIKCKFFLLKKLLSYVELDSIEDDEEVVEHNKATVFIPIVHTMA